MLAPIILAISKVSATMSSTEPSQSSSFANRSHTRVSFKKKMRLMMWNDEMLQHIIIGK